MGRDLFEVLLNRRQVIARADVSHLGDYRRQPDRLVSVKANLEEFALNIFFWGEVLPEKHATGGAVADSGTGCKLPMTRLC